ncbi:hypothetical protein HanOQP8_Chr03g0086071 [Helianthus annuus]|nr:hypothetical protein HanOQP8_Chr03g0086071 [Helianthus annuus]
MAEILQPVQVLYCGICSLPAEYCEFGADFEKCKPWLIRNAPQLYPDLIQESNSKAADGISDQLQSSSITDGTEPSGNFKFEVAYLCYTDYTYTR